MIVQTEREQIFSMRQKVVVTCLVMVVTSSCRVDALDESLNLSGESCCKSLDELWEAELVRWTFEALRDIFISWGP